MKRYGNLFERIVDINNIVLAHLNARKGKTKDKEVRRVDRDILGHCVKIRQMLIEKAYTTSEYHIFEIEDNGKQRTIAELPYYPDRIIQWAIIQVLEKPFMKHFIPTTYAALPGEKKWNKKTQKAHKHERSARRSFEIATIHGERPERDKVLLEARR